MGIKSLKEAADTELQVREFMKGTIVEGDDTQAVLLTNGSMTVKDKKTGASAVFSKKEVVALYGMLDKFIDELKELK